MKTHPHCVALWLRDRKQEWRVGKPCRRRATWVVYFAGTVIKTCRHHRNMVCRELRLYGVECKFERIRKKKHA